MNYIKNFFAAFKPLFFENKKLSLGRISFWIVLLILCWYWIRAGLIIDVNVTIPDAPSSLQFAFATLLAYNMGKKVKSVFTKGKKELETTDNGE